MPALRYTLSNYPLDSDAQIEQWFSKFSVNKNYLRNLLTYIFLGLLPWDYGLEVPGWGLGIYIASKSDLIQIVCA